MTPSLDQLWASRPTEQDHQLIEGELTTQGSDRYLRVDGAPALWGPLEGATGRADGDVVLVGISHLGNYWVIAPDG